MMTVPARPGPGARVRRRIIMAASIVIILLVLLFADIYRIHGAAKEAKTNEKAMFKPKVPPNINWRGIHGALAARRKAKDRAEKAARKSRRDAARSRPIKLASSSLSAGGGRPISKPGMPFRKLRDTLYGRGVDLYKDAKTVPSDLTGYRSSTQLKAPLIDTILARLRREGLSYGLWVEAGSFGNSAIVAAKRIQELGNPATMPVVAIDPFSGDVKNETFLANVAASGLVNQILPIQATSVVGLKLLTRLEREQRIDTVPVVIYLDSAHEKNETMVELQAAWKVLQKPGGVFLGDDFHPRWQGVVDAVIAFAKGLRLPLLTEDDLRAWDLPGEKKTRQIVPGLMLYPSTATWLIPVPPWKPGMPPNY